MSAASYLSSFLNSTTSKYNNLKQSLISSDTDGDTEDDSHISRVLRAYYTEKGRPFPEWLPPDPKAPPPPQPASYGMVMASQGQPQMATGGRWARGGGISDLWDGPKGGQQQMQQPESLRQPRIGQQAGGDQGGGRPGRFGDLYGDPGSNRPQTGGRLASYESASRLSAKAPSPAPSVGSGGTAKDMLKAKFSWGNRTTSPTPSTGSGTGNYAQAGKDNSPAFGGRGGDSNPFGGSKDSVTRFKTPSYGDDRGGGYGDGSSGRQGDSGTQWGGDSFSSGAQGGIKRGPQGGRMGLPSGPRPQRF